MSAKFAAHGFALLPGAPDARMVLLEATAEDGGEYLLPVPLAATRSVTALARFSTSQGWLFRNDFLDLSRYLRDLQTARFAAQAQAAPAAPPAVPAARPAPRSKETPPVPAARPSRSRPSPAQAGRPRAYVENVRTRPGWSFLTYTVRRDDGRRSVGLAPVALAARPDDLVAFASWNTAGRPDLDPPSVYLRTLCRLIADDPRTGPHARADFALGDRLPARKPAAAPPIVWTPAMLRQLGEGLHRMGLPVPAMDQARREELLKLTGLGRSVLTDGHAPAVR